LPQSLTVFAALCGAALCLATAASASSGGAAMPPPPVTAKPANVTVSASANGMTIASRESAVLRTSAVVNGSLPAAQAGRTVEIELLGARTSWSWQPVATTQVQRDGTYSASWRPRHAGKFEVRALVEQSGAGIAGASPTITVIVYRPAGATLYGPGFWGKHTACGKVLRRWTIGVANRTLPCGTRVAIYYGGQMLVVPVIDRGPYANGADWDLTMATGAALGIDTTVTVGAVPLAHAH
jgi:rare lipoprotein A (peptidoglycan hydrolase)